MMEPMEIEKTFDYVELGFVIIGLMIAGIVMIAERVDDAKEKRKGKSRKKKR